MQIDRLMEAENITHLSYLPSTLDQFVVILLGGSGLIKFTHLHS